ncbi:aquaporin-like protein [Favolaschia claudopus]|uniref:Aquaporin-like protein n=1 Tax=Favolaschia claudopus TaxID=2862362 RepID=A0AAW0CB80_9AGAR
MATKVPFSASNERRIVYVADVIPRPRYLAGWERLRHGKLHWLAECVAEAMGVFMYCFAGVGSTAAFVIGGLAKEEGLSSLLQIGLGYAAGIMLAITICSATSGGHFNPCITIVEMLFKGFPPLKGARYIVSQILGGYIACLLVYTQWSTLIKAVEAAIPPTALAAINFTPQGPAGILGLYVSPTASLGLAFLNEFICDFFIGLVIFGCLDPSNAMVPPSMAPVLISMAYAAAIWGFSANGLAANTARDLGGRFAAMTIYGSDAVGRSGYAAIAALTNIPATILAFLFYEFMFYDSDRVVPQDRREFIDIHALHRRHGPATLAAAAAGDNHSSSSGGHEKEHVGTIERV